MDYTRYIRSLVYNFLNSVIQKVNFAYNYNYSVVYVIRVSLRVLVVF